MLWIYGYVIKSYCMIVIPYTSLRFEAEADITLIGMREDGRDIENFGQKFIGVDAGGHRQAEYFSSLTVW